MAELNIKCACGRTMTLDGRRGRGAFRCGCGAAIRVTEKDTPSTACSVDGCRTASVTGSKIKLCEDHKNEVTMILAHDIARTDLKHLVELQEAGPGRWRPPVIAVYAGPEVGPTDAAIVRELPESGRHESIVYFMLNGDRVKIGYTTHLAARLMSLSLHRSNVVLALDGGRELEGRLHRRFHQHRINGEWFNYTDEIRTFIEARRGAPKLS